MTRDYQRSLLYAAEQEVRHILDIGGIINHFGSTLPVGEERKFGDVASIGPYLDRVLAYGPVARLPRSQVPVTVRERRGITKATYDYDDATIAIPPHQPGHGGKQAWALRELVVLHELAHHLCGPAQPEGHGPEFVATFIYLVEHVMDPVVAHLLRVACFARGVRIGPTP